MRRTTPSTELDTVLFTDIVSSTDIAREVGDRRWRALVAAHHGIVRQALKRHQGKELDTAGDGFFATFPRPAEAIRCACEVSEAVREFGLETGSSSITSITRRSGSTPHAFVTSRTPGAWRATGSCSPIRRQANAWPA